VDCMVRGGSSPLGRTGKAYKCRAFLMSVETSAAAMGVIRQRATVALRTLIGSAQALLWSRDEHLGS
jgi:hypothetical protein